MGVVLLVVALLLSVVVVPPDDLTCRPRDGVRALEESPAIAEGGLDGDDCITVVGERGSIMLLLARDVRVVVLLLVLTSPDCCRLDVLNMVPLVVPVPLLPTFPLSCIPPPPPCSFAIL